MKKEHSNWYLALIHFSVAAVAMPILVFILLYSAYSLVTAMTSLEYSENIHWVFEESLYLVTLWLGVMYSARFMARKHLVSNANAVTLYSVTYLFILSAGFAIFDLVSFTNTFVDATLNIGLVLLEIGVFYFLTKKYLREDTFSVGGEVN